MQDKWKQYIDENRDDLEIYQPREHLWEKIDGRLQSGHKKIIWRRLAVAASLLLVITCGTFLFVEYRHKAIHETAVQPPIGETEAYFTAIVQMKDAELEQYCKPQPELCREFSQDLEALNSAYKQLKKEYSVAADKKTILQAMVANLQMQVQLINRQLQIMETVKQKKTEVKVI